MTIAVDMGRKAAKTKNKHPFYGTLASSAEPDKMPQNSLIRFCSICLQNVLLEFE